MRKRAAVFALIFIAAFSFPAYATMSYECSTGPASKATVTWWADGGADEYRILKGSSDESGFDSAAKAGSGARASKEITANGNYTLYSKQSDVIEYIIAPVSTVDVTSPDITVTHMQMTGDDEFEVSYAADDYNGIRDIRIISGDKDTDCYENARSVQGGTIDGLKSGSYTIFAEDKAGNISKYSFTCSAKKAAENLSSQWKADDPYSESWEYYGNDIFLETESEVAETKEAIKSLPQTGGFDERMSFLSIVAIVTIVSLFGFIILSIRRPKGEDTQ